MSIARLPVFENFISDLRAVWAAQPDLQRRMETAKPLLEKFVKDDSIKAHSANWPSTEGHKNLLLYVDPEHDLVAVVRWIDNAAADGFVKRLIAAMAEKS